MNEVSARLIDIVLELLHGLFSRKTFQSNDQGRVKGFDLLKFCDNDTSYLLSVLESSIAVDVNHFGLWVVLEQHKHILNLFVVSLTTDIAEWTALATKLSDEIHACLCHSSSIWNYTDVSVRLYEFYSLLFRGSLHRMQLRIVSHTLNLLLPIASIWVSSHEAMGCVKLVVFRKDKGINLHCESISLYKTLPEIFEQKY